MKRSLDGFKLSDLKFVMVLVMLIARPAATIAADPPPPASTDDELRKSLENESMQDYDRELLGDAASKAKDKASIPKDSAAKPAGENVPEPLKRELGAASQAEKTGQSPMAKVVQAMRDVQPRLAHRDAGETTQHIEDQIVHDLDRLVEEARKSCCGGQCNKPSNCNKPSDPNKPSSPTAGDKKVAAPHENPSQRSNEKRTAALPSNSEADARDFRTLVKRLWGELPEIERQRMLALPDEEFLPQYEEQTKQYLRRLSERKENPERQP